MTRTLPAAWRSLQRALFADLERHSSALQSWTEHHPEFAAHDGPAVVAALSAGASARDLVACAVVQHQRGCPAATTALLLSRLPMLVSVSRHVHVDPADYDVRFEVQLQAALTAFMSVISDVDHSSEHLVHSLYWECLHRVTDRRHRVEVATYADMSVFEDLVCDVVNTESCGDVVADLLALYASANGRPISHRDEATLRAMYARPASATVAEVAAEIGVSEHAFESRLRRALGRLRDGLPATARATVLAA